MTVFTPQMKLVKKEIKSVDLLGEYPNTWLSVQLIEFGGPDIFREFRMDKENICDLIMSQSDLKSFEERVFVDDHFFIEVDYNAAYDFITPIELKQLAVKLIEQHISGTLQIETRLKNDNDMDVPETAIFHCDEAYKRQLANQYQGF